MWLPTRIAELVAFCAPPSGARTLPLGLALDNVVPPTQSYDN